LTLTAMRTLYLLLILFSVTLNFNILRAFRVSYRYIH
jgi:hypothetical protein